MLRTAAIQIESRQDQKIFAQVPKSQGKIFLRVGPKSGPSLDPIRIVWAGAIKQSRPAGFATANFYHGTGYARERSNIMRFWIVQKQDTVEAIIDAIRTGACTTEEQVEAIAAQMGDTIAWAGTKPFEKQIKGMTVQ